MRLATVITVPTTLTEEATMTAHEHSVSRTGHEVCECGSKKLAEQVYGLSRRVVELENRLRYAAAVARVDMQPEEEKP